MIVMIWKNSQFVETKSSSQAERKKARLSLCYRRNYSTRNKTKLSNNNFLKSKHKRYVIRLKKQHRQKKIRLKQNKSVVTL